MCKSNRVLTGLSRSVMVIDVVVSVCIIGIILMYVGSVVL